MEAFRSRGVSSQSLMTQQGASDGLVPAHTYIPPRATRWNRHPISLHKIPAPRYRATPPPQRILGDGANQASWRPPDNSVQLSHCRCHVFLCVSYGLAQFLQYDIPRGDPSVSSSTTRVKRHARYQNALRRRARLLLLLGAISSWRYTVSSTQTSSTSKPTRVVPCST